MLNLLVLFGVTAVAFALVIGLMAVGVMMGRREIKGSCGGLGSGSGEAGESSCSLCSNPDAACRELARRGAGQASQQSSSLAAEMSMADAAGPHDPCDRQCEDHGCTPEEIEACNLPR